MEYDLKDIVAQFQVLGDYYSAKPYGSGHINDTYEVTMVQGGRPVRYILQRINHNVFKDPVSLVDNIDKVTSHIRKKLAGEKDISRRVLTMIPDQSGKYCYIHDDLSYWRLYIFIEKASTWDTVQSVDQAYEAARAFGSFQAQLADLDPNCLTETIPDFHHTVRRYEQLKNAIENDSHKRVNEAQKEIDYVLSFEDDAKRLISHYEQGELPLRVTHNDTKLNNVMLDDLSGKGTCVIDLDTVMPGLSLYDFGDIVRTSCRIGAEDDSNPNNISFNRAHYEVSARGFLETTGSIMNTLEKELLPFSGKLITLEIGVRFLTDFLEGDQYFKIHRPKHNFDRAKMQFKMVKEIDKVENELQDLNADLI